MAHGPPAFHISPDAALNSTDIRRPP